MRPARASALAGGHGARVAPRPAGGRRGRPPGGAGRDVRVDLRRREALVAEQLLDDPQVRAAVEQMGRERVPQRVRRDAVREAGRRARRSRR